MRALGKLQEVHRTMDGKIVCVFEMDEIDQKSVEEIRQEGLLDITAVKHRKKRSLDANAYFWTLCDKMAKRLESDKWTVYLLLLSKYGQFADVAVIDDAFPVLQNTFRYTEILKEWEDEGHRWIVVRCYKGSSGYNTQEMGELIHCTVRDAADLGIETLTPRELEEMLAAWKGGQYVRTQDVREDNY